MTQERRGAVRLRKGETLVSLDRAVPGGVVRERYIAVEGLGKSECIRVGGAVYQRRGFGVSDAGVYDVFVRQPTGRRVRYRQVKA